ncbi:hypothetical protein [Leucobacter denitrificans]|uniref:Uncharacterized protein n=1 Tax=Leucobacter denitrificans TaxID=683042 RepID=A0A7G9S5E2_9MICO|nr:hypothetical protein [Leucobacter denitrificans]QNN63067.1 hypothetical protein H9L06_01425 [Leucobacter denitrificans]
MTPDRPPSRLRRATAWYGAVSDILTPQRLALVAGALALGAVGIFGGWDAVSDADDEVPTYGSGAEFVATPFEVSTQRARVFDELAGAFYAEDGYRYIALLVDVTNTSDRPVPAYTLSESISLDVHGVRTIELEDGPKQARPTILRGIDGLTQYTFQPGLTTNVVIGWQQEVSAAIPDDATIVFSGNIWRRSTLDDSLGWRDPVPAARVTLPVEPLESEDES